MTTLLVVDDDPLFCRAVQDIFGDTMETIVAATGSRALETVGQHSVDVVLLDQNLQDAQGHELCQRLLRLNDRLKILLITAFPNFKNAVSAVKAGAYDYLSKPVDPDELVLQVNKALKTTKLEAIAQYVEYQSSRESAESLLVGNCLDPIRQLIRTAAGSDSPIVITGETGTGKNMVARAVHYAGPRSNASFISINCAAIPESLFEDELFGHEKGAYTGALSSRKGIFEMADTGTLVLDEISEMPLFLQAKLLSAIEDKQIRRVGSEVFRRVNARVIAATNKNIEEAVNNHQFRSDLFYRLSIIRIHIPPLRERRSDIPALSEYLLTQILGAPIELPAQEMQSLMDYPWPGNVRELRNVLERAALLSGGKEIRPSIILNGPLILTPPGSGNEPVDFIPLRKLERDYILKALAANDGNISKTARILGLSLATMKRRLKMYRKKELQAG